MLRKQQTKMVQGKKGSGKKRGSGKKGGAGFNPAGAITGALNGALSGLFGLGVAVGRGQKGKGALHPAYTTGKGKGKKK